MHRGLRNANRIRRIRVRSGNRGQQTRRLVLFTYTFTFNQYPSRFNSIQGEIVSEFSSILYEVEDGRSRITLNRPEKLNALSLRLQSELNEALWEADNNIDVHCVILRGAGRAFSAGYDLTGADHNVPVSRIQSLENRVPRRKQHRRRCMAARACATLPYGDIRHA